VAGFGDIHKEKPWGRRDQGRAARDGSLSPPAPRTPGRTKGSPQDLGRRGFPDPARGRAVWPLDCTAFGRRRRHRCPSGTDDG